MKLNKKERKNNLLFKSTYRKFLLNSIFLSIGIAIVFLIMALIIARFDFQWLYDFSPMLYDLLYNIWYTMFDYGYWIFIIPIIWMVSIAILLYRTMKKGFSYISDLKNAANQLFDKNIEYITLPSELQDIETSLNHLKYESEKNERLARENEQRKNDLIVYLAHDLKTPLTSVIGYLELLKESPDLPISQRAKYTDITLEKAYRLEDLMNEFFEVARFNDTQIVLMKKNLNLKLMLEQIVDEFYPITNEQDKCITINCDENITIYADPDKLSRVLNNVIKNAITYSFENTTIKISATLENDLININIENEGYTIPKDKLDLIFDKFYRLDSSRGTSNGGAGLGLAIAKEILNLHGGNISATSIDNITTFTLIIPQNNK